MSQDGLTCKTCGKEVNRALDSECVNCYIGSHLPSKVHDDPWVWAIDFRRIPSPRREKPDPETVAIGCAIINGKCEVSGNKQSIRMMLDDKHYDIPFTAEALDSLARRTGILGGKWLVYRPHADIDDAWKLVAKAVFDRTLGAGAKVSTINEPLSKRRHVICVYTRNYLDLEDVRRVRGLLREMGFTEALCYKPDIYTYLNIYSGTTKLSPCRYRE